MSTVPRPTRTAALAGPGVVHEKRVTAALFAAGLTTFAAMYSTQSLLPSLSAAFAVPPAHAALAVSLTTGFLALAIIPAGVLSARVGRTRVMIGSAVVASALGLLLPLCPTLDTLLAVRAVQGVALAGVPAVAMAYLAEEIGAAELGAAMGIYIAGTTIGGLAGRLIPSLALGLTSWRWAELAVSLAAAACTVWFARSLPPSRGFVARPAGFGTVVGDLTAQLRHRGLIALFGLAFLLMGSFVSVYNFLGYRLTHRPFELPAALAGSVFVLYLAGTIASACTGRLTDRRGHARVLTAAVTLMAAGVLVTIPDHLTTVLIGVLLFTTGFFAAHTTASAWVGALAENRGAASSLYMFAYYLGSAVVGSAAGIAYAGGGWIGLVACVAALFMIAALLLASLVTAGRPARARRRYRCRCSCTPDSGCPR
ncbi:MFS transporter [Nocardia aurantiaca]|uniref:MFS transporter n=1 Tax=Nocardia aurantiaca TaxID=2675850 RepID=A0A6I3LBH5_9NOCA|nr:MFS transporter [Nocardia aurantiaca]MTE17229.1 MFS transporter [Nocardia aurantiaca]